MRREGKGVYGDEYSRAAASTRGAQARRGTAKKMLRSVGCGAQTDPNFAPPTAQAHGQAASPQISNDSDVPGDPGSQDESRVPQTR
jgi:hypothetical protein